MEIEVMIGWKISPAIWTSIGVELLIMGIIICVGIELEGFVWWESTSHYCCWGGFEVINMCILDWMI